MKNVDVVHLIGGILITTPLALVILRFTVFF
nr:MAG TPA: hypothetical protein [Caudoviricetes sp.]